MATLSGLVKKIFDCFDAKPIVVYGRQTATDNALPVVASSTGELKVNQSGVTTIPVPVQVENVTGEEIPVSGTITVNAGTNLNTSALALESGGNLATIAGDTTSIDGKIVACDTTNLAFETGNLAVIAGDTTSIDGKIVACDTNNVTIGAELPSGTQLIGKVGIDQTTDGTTNKVVVNAYNSKTLTYLPIRQDGNTNALQIINYEHHEIHSGSHFFISDFSDLSINTVFDMQFATPTSTGWVHFTWKINTEGEMLWHIYENVSVLTIGTTVTNFNSDRNSTKTSGALVNVVAGVSEAVASTYTSTATSVRLMAGISGAGKQSGSDSRENEVILKQNTTYLFRGFATSAGFIDFSTNWYEHINVS